MALGEYTICHAVLFSIGVAWRKKNLEFVIPGFLIILVLGLEIKRIRYLRPIFPMVALAAAYGLGHIGISTLKKVSGSLFHWGVPCAGDGSLSSVHLYVEFCESSKIWKISQYPLRGISPGAFQCPQR